MAYTPDDPVVLQMVDRGLRFIEKKELNNPGEVVLIAYAHYKAEHDESNPAVQRGIRQAQRFAAELPKGQQYKSNYECAVSVLLLCEVAPDRFRSELAAFQRYFNEVQMGHGGYAYPDDKDGDVSQTQYAILAIWMLDRFGYKVDYNRLKKTADWLFAVQDVNGPWPYHGKLPTRGGLIAQAETSHSMALAGAASLLIAGDAMGMWGDKSSDEDTGIVGLPKAVKLFQEDDNADRRKKAVKLNSTQMFNAIERMEAWRKAKPEKLGANLYWYFYTAYTMERFYSFVEIATGAGSDPSPSWYNKIVGELKAKQASSGGWEDRAHTNASVSTAFAILFLIRSTKKSLGDGASATSRGGQGFAKDVSNATLKNGSSFTRAPAQSVTNMLDLLEGEEADRLDGKALADNATLPTNPVERSAQLDRLERLVRGSKSWQARRVSAKLLGQSDEFRVVPALIFALSDPDDMVRAYARDGLRFISRNFEGYGMPDEPTNSDIRKAQRSWREWYKRVHPDFVFIDE